MTAASCTGPDRIQFFAYFCVNRMLRQILTYHLAFLMLLTNIGVPVFKHVCHTQNKTWASLYVPAKSCCRKEKSSGGWSRLPSAGKQTGFSSRPCCENHSGLLRLDTEFYCSNPSWGHAALDHVAVLSPIDEFPSVEITPFFHSTGSPHGPPVVLHGRSLLIAHQVFRC